jgi:hypothetical protein
MLLYSVIGSAQLPETSVLRCQLLPPTATVEPPQSHAIRGRSWTINAAVLSDWLNSITGNSCFEGPASASNGARCTFTKSSTPKTVALEVE